MDFREAKILAPFVHKNWKEKNEFRTFIVLTNLNTMKLVMRAKKNFWKIPFPR